MRWTANYVVASSTYFAMPQDPEHYSLYEHEVDSYNSTYTRNSFNLTADLKLYKNGTLSAALSQNSNMLENGQRQVRWSTGRLAGEIDRAVSTLTSTVSPATAVANNSVLNNTYYLFRGDQNRQGSIKFRHDGPVWTADLGASYGTARSSNQDLDRGYLFSSLFNLLRTNLRFDNVGPWGIGTITALRNGVPVSPLDLNTFTNAGGFSNTVAGTSPSVTITSSLPPMRTKPVYSSDLRKQANGSLTRSFDFKLLPTTVKIGFNLSEYHREQSLDPVLGTNAGFIYNGLDIPLTEFLNRTYNVALPNGYGVPSSVDNRKLADFFNAHRGQLVQINQGEDYRTAVLNSREINESIAAGYIRFDSRLWASRIYLVYGLRYERTWNDGRGPYGDVTLNYRRNAAGQFVSAAGVPVNRPTLPALIYTAGSIDAIKATWFERVAHANRTYDNYFPSVNLNYNLTENMVARVSYSQTIGRPDLSNIAPGLTLPDLSRNQTATDVNSYIRISNPNVEPWTSKNVSLSLEYYSKNLGDVTVRAYRRFVSNAFVNQILPPIEAAQYLEDYGVDSTLYGSSYVSTLVNIPGTVVTSGLELSTRYSLDEFMPAWAQGLQIKSSASRSTMTGGGTAATAFGAQSLYLLPYSIGGGITLNRKRFSISVNAKWNAQQRLAYIDPAADVTVEPGTYLYNNANLRVDLDAMVNLSKTLSLFVNGRDINGYELIQQRYSPTTPKIARNLLWSNFQPVWTLGLRATF